MDYNELIERLRTDSLYDDKASLEIMDLCMDAATAIEALHADLRRLQTERDTLWAANQHLLAERDADRKED